MDKIARRSRIGFAARKETRMQIHRLSPGEWGKTIAVGIGVAILTALVMVSALKSGISPLPKPLGLAFAETLLRTQLPLPVGLLFHTAWVTFFTAVYVALFREALTFMRAFWLGTALWALVLVFFFPLVGWDFLGLGVTPKLIVAAAVPHLLFSILLWGFCRLAFGQPDTVKEAGNAS
jgi:hypothetical protein